MPHVPVTMMVSYPVTMLTHSVVVNISGTMHQNSSFKPSRTFVTARGKVNSRLPHLKAQRLDQCMPFLSQALLTVHLEA